MLTLPESLHVAELQQLPYLEDPGGNDQDRRHELGQKRCAVVV